VHNWSKDFPPPADAYAFYLPFHYYYPVFWGIYLVAEGVLELAMKLHEDCKRYIDMSDSIRATRLYLFKHEYFHQKAETFSAKLEVSHRVRIYIDGQMSYYRRSFGTERCLEEALAEAYAYRECENILKAKWHWPKRKRYAFLKVLEQFIKSSPPGYRDGIKYFKKEAYESGLYKFAETCVFEERGLPTMDAEVWQMFRRAFDAVGNIKSRVNYTIHKDSPLSRRLDLKMERVSYQELQKKLHDICSCKFKRTGKGSHMIWEAPNGTPFSVPRHPRELKTGTLGGIIKKACGGMSLHEFLHKD
jgi:predicted RNA binding protein YcfA (HicA-like mRNA interferase family)